MTTKLTKVEAYALDMVADGAEAAIEDDPVEDDYQAFDGGGLTVEQEIRLDVIRALIGQEGAAGFNDDAQPAKVAKVLTAFADPLVDWVLHGRPAAPTPSQDPDGSTPTT